MKLHVAVAVVLASCLPPAQQPGYPSGPQQAAGITCIQIVECLAQCPQDATCHQGCMARGDDSSRAAMSALINCNALEGAECEAELSACRSQTPQVAAQDPQPQPQYTSPAPVTEEPEAMMPGQPHTTANILPWMTGNWEGNNYHYTFWADGRVRRASGVALYTKKTGEYACASIVNETGTVTQEGDLLIMRFAAAQENHCGDTAAAPELTVRYKIQWYQYNGPVELKLIDIDCTRGAMYCNDPIRRR